MTASAPKRTLVSGEIAVSSRQHVDRKCFARNAFPLCVTNAENYQTTMRSTCNTIKKQNAEQRFDSIKELMRGKTARFFGVVVSLVPTQPLPQILRISEPSAVSATSRRLPTSQHSASLRRYSESGRSRRLALPARRVLSGLGPIPWVQSGQEAARIPFCPSPFRAGSRRYLVLSRCARS